MKAIKLLVGDPDDNGKTLNADVSTDESDPAAWLRNARDCAWQVCLHHGATVTVIDPDDDDTPVVRVSCEWLEGEDDDA